MGRNKLKNSKKLIPAFLVLVIFTLSGCQLDKVKQLITGKINSAAAAVSPVGNITNPGRQKAKITDGLTMGDPNAKVKVIEFADFQCPGCGNYWSTTEPTIIKDYVDSGKVLFTFSPFSFVGSFVQGNSWDESVKAAEAAYCANDQGKFWEYHDYLFANQNGENEGAFKRERLIAFAHKIGLDHQTFVDCLDTAKHHQDVLDANDYATNSGINSTPSFIVNGTTVDSSTLIQTLDNDLK
jgi:protein-disulfide isomerase